MKDSEKDEALKNYGKYEYIKHNENDTIYWVSRPVVVGEMRFTFDKKTIYNLFSDYPYNMTEKEIEQFDKENPEWAKFFADRKQPGKKGGD